MACGAIMEYDGRTVEVVARGVKAGSNGSTTKGSATGAAAAAAFFFFVFFGLAAAPRPPRARIATAAKTAHIQLFK